MHEGEVGRERGVDRHQVEDIAGAAVVGQRHDDQLVDAIAEERAQLANALVVGAVAAGDGKGALVDPGDVAALNAALAGDLASDRNAPRLGGAAQRSGFGAAVGFAHRAKNEAAVADDAGVANVD